MPSPVGHALAGLTVALASDPERQLGRSWPRVAVACAALAIAPDLDLLYPRGHRTFTHSFFAAGLVLLTTLAVTRQGGKLQWRISVACTLAYATHLLTDYFGADYGTPSGLQLWWPWAMDYFKSDVEIFRMTERHDPLSAFAIQANLAALAQELLVIGPFAALAWWRRRQSRTPRV